MPDIFSTEPPRWLQAIAQPIDTKLTGQALAAVLGGATTAAQRSHEMVQDAPDQPFHERGGGWLGNFLPAMTEAKLSMADPLWRVKAQALQLRTQGDVLGLIQQEQSIKMNRTKMANEARDLDIIPKWMQDHPTVESRMNAEWPVAYSAEWNNTLNQIRARDSQSVLARTTVAGVNAFAKRVDALSKRDPTAAARFSTVQGVPTPEDLQRLADAEAKAPPLPTTGQPIAQKYLTLADQEDTQAETARVAGDVDGYQAHKERADNYRALAAPKVGTTEMTMGPEGPKVVQSYGPKPTVAAQTRAQESTVKYENATTLINQLQKSLRREDVGVAGLGGELILDRTLAQLYPQFADRERVANRTALAALRESLLRQMSDDPRFSNLDRQVIQDMLPSTGAFESLEDAKARMTRVREILADRARAYALSTRSPIPDFAKTEAELTSEYHANTQLLQREVDAGRLTPAQAYTQIDQLHRRLTEAMQRYH